MTAERLNDYLRSVPVRDGLLELSPERPFQHDEADYDRQYGMEEVPLESYAEDARHVLALCRKHGMGESASILEIGCGTGRLSVGLALQEGIGRLILTDPSPAFCRITRAKVERVAAKVPSIDYGILLAEDAGRFPSGLISVILLRSVLHHVLDVPAFLANCAKILPAGGLLICEEPYFDGYLAMGLVTTFLENALAARGYLCSSEEKAKIAEMVASMQYYSRRDVDKSQAEDKHLFKPDELMTIGWKHGLRLDHYPNWRLTKPDSANAQDRVGHFSRFYRDYLQYCMRWPADFATRAVDSIRENLRYLEPLETTTEVAFQCFGTFVFTKL